MGYFILPLVVSTLGGLVFGYELGIISGALLQLKAEFLLSCVQQEVLVSSLLFGALLASFIGGCLIDHHGRKNTITFSNILILTGSLVLLPDFYPAVVVGRITVGFGLCIASMSCCIFVSEMVAPDCRGFMVILYEAGITLGILVAYSINYFFSNYRRGWKWMFGFATVPTVVQLFSLWYLSSSTKEGRRSKRHAMRRFETQETDDSKIISSEDYQTVQCDIMYLFQTKDNMRTRTLLGLGLVFFQQFTGQPNIIFYASTIFSSMGFKNNDSAALASTVLGLVKVFATLTSMMFSDRVGRRPMLITGCSVMALSLITAGLLIGNSPMNAKRPCNSDSISVNITDLPNLLVRNQSVYGIPLVENQRFLNNSQDEHFIFDKLEQDALESARETSHTTSTAVNWILFTCMVSVVFAYSIGFGPMTWLLLSEIYPAAVRGRAFSFINGFNWAANLLVTFTFLNVLDTLGLSKMFCLYGMIALVAAIFFYFMLPETKGKTLEEIDKELRLNRFYNSEECSGCMGKRKTLQYQRVQCQISTSG